MKRKELLAKSLAVGLAVAMAASSMSAPGGLFVPLEVRAEEPTKDAGATDFTITTESPVLKSKEDIAKGVAVTVAEAEGSEYDGTITTVKYKGADASDYSAEAPKKAGKYEIAIDASAGTDYKALQNFVVGTVVIYETLPDGTKLTYKVGEEGEEITDPAEKKFNGDVTVSCTGATVAVVPAVTDYVTDVTGETGEIKTPEDGDTVSAYMLVKKDDTVYAQKVELTFDLVKPDISVAVDNITSAGATITVTEENADADTEYALVLKKGEEAVDAGNITQKEKVFTIKNLTEGTEYSYEITATDPAGNQTVETGTFSTIAKKQVTADDFSIKKPIVEIKDGFTGIVEKAADGYDGASFTVTYKAAGASDYTDTAPTDSGTYTIAVSGDATGSYKAFENVEIGTISVYAQLQDGTATLSYKVGQTEKNESDKFNANVTVSAGADTAIAVVDALPAYNAGDITKAEDTIAKPSADGPKEVYVLVKKEDKVYAKKVTLTFDVTPPTVTATVSDYTNDTVKITVTASDTNKGTCTVVLKDAGGQEAGSKSENDPVYTFSGLTGGTTYSYTVTVTDTAGNETVKTGSVTTLDHEPFTGTLAISGSAVVGSELRAAVTGGDNDAVYTYQWSRTKDGTTTEITGATEAAYTVSKDDVGATLTVKAMLTGDDGAVKEKVAVSGVAEKKTCEITLAAAAALYDAEPAGEGAARVLAVHTESADGAALEYSLDGGSTWKDLSGTSIPVGASAYDSGKIQVRVKETDEAKAGTAVSYDKAIAASSGGTDTPGTDTPGDSGSGSGGSGSSGGSGAATPSDDANKPVTETKPDGTVVTTTEEKKEDGTVVTTTEEKSLDGSSKTTVEEKKADGSSTTQVALKNESAGAQATVHVAKDAEGKVTAANAAVTQTVPDKTATISAAVVSDIAEAAGTKDVVVTEKVMGTNGKTVCKITVNLSDLAAGNDMKVLKINKQTGELTLINQSTYTVAEDGSVSLSDLKTANYILVTAGEADAFSKEVLASVKAEQSKKSVPAGKKAKVTLSDDLNMDNVAKVTYTSSRKSVATVNKNGTVTAKKAGKVTIRVKVTLKNGQTKTVKVTVTVKK